MYIKEKVYEDLMTSEVNFIAQCWKKSYRSSYEFFYMRTATYYERFGPVVDYLIKNSKLKMAYDDNGLLLGFCCYEEDCLHYVYLKELERNKGYSKQLVPDNLRYVSHFNKDFKEHFHTRRTQKDQLEFDPFRKYGGEND